MTHRVGLSFPGGPLLRVKPELLRAQYLAERSALCLTSKGTVVFASVRVYQAHSCQNHEVPCPSSP